MPSMACVPRKRQRLKLHRDCLERTVAEPCLQMRQQPENIAQDPDKYGSVSDNPLKLWGECAAQFATDRWPYE